MEVHTLRAMAIRRGMSDRHVSAAAGKTVKTVPGGGEFAQAWLTDPGVAYSAQVAAAATAAGAHTRPLSSST